MRPIWCLMVLLVAGAMAGCGSDGQVAISVGDPAATAPNTPVVQSPPVVQDNDVVEGLTTGLYTLNSFGVERTFWLQLPGDYSPEGDKKALIVAFHGTGGSYLNWLAGGRYGDGLIDQAGNDAIVVMPNALPGAGGTNNWDPDYDFEFFLDLITKIQRDVGYDPNRLFVTGHSSGGGFTHEIGCRYGDIVRAIAPSAGALTSSRCVGSVGVMMIQGTKDSIVPISIVEPSRTFWVLYNGFEASVFEDAAVPPCIDYSLGASLYPLQWCQHEEGDGPTAHNWASFSDEAIWGFFSSLPDAAPSTDEPPGGGNDRISEQFPASISFTLAYPDDIGTVTRLAVVLYPAGSRQPFPGAPIWFMNTDIAPGDAAPGAVVSYLESVALPPLVPGFFDYPGEYAIAFTIYVEGGGFPIPVAGVDHSAVIDATIVDEVSAIILPDPLDVVPVVSDF